MISTRSMPAARRLSATNAAARSTSGECSGNVLMLGIRMNSFSSFKNRRRFSFTNASVAADMVSAKPLYGDGWRALAGAMPAGIGEDAADFRFVKRLRDQVVGAQVQGLGPE